MRKFLLSLIEQFGYKVTKFDRKAAGPYADIQDNTFWSFYEKCQPYTMTSVDEYFAERKTSILLQRIDYTGRLAIKK